MIRTPEGVLRGGVGGRAEAAGAERKEFSKMGRDFFFFFLEKDAFLNYWASSPSRCPREEAGPPWGTAAWWLSRVGPPALGLRRPFIPASVAQK